jgi:hypothetical protein
MASQVPFEPAMFTPPKLFALRRMKLEDIAQKLAQIEEQAALTVAEYPRGLTVERQRLIQGLARQLRAHINDQLRNGERTPLVEAEPPSAGSHLEAVQNRTASNAS